MAQNNSLTSQALTLTAGRGLAFAFSFFVPLYLVRIFNQGDFGSYKQILLITTTLVIISDLGTSASLYYFLPRLVEKRKVFVLQAVLLLLFTSILAGTGLALLSGKIGIWFNNPALSELMLIAALYSALMVLSLPLEHLLIIEKKIKIASVLIIFFEGTKLILILVLTAIKANLKLLLIAFVIYGFVRVIVFAIYLARNYNFGRGERGTLSFRTVTEQMSYAMPFGMSVIFFTFELRLHQYLVSVYYDSAIFAIYAVGSFEIPFVAMLFQSAGEIMLVRASELQKENNYEEMNLLWRNSIRKLGIMFFPIFFFLLFQAKNFVVTLFTENYMRSVPIFMVFIFYIPLSILIPDSIIRAFNETKYILKIYIFKFCFSLVLILALLKYSGMIGAVIGATVSLLVVKLILTRKVYRLIRTNLWEGLPGKELAQICLVSVVLGGCVSLVTDWLPVSTLMRLLIAFGVFTGVYAFFIYRSNVLTEGEKDTLFRHFKELIKRIGSSAVFSWVSR